MREHGCARPHTAAADTRRWQQVHSVWTEDSHGIEEAANARLCAMLEQMTDEYWEKVCNVLAFHNGATLTEMPSLKRGMTCTVCAPEIVDIVSSRLYDRFLHVSEDNLAAWTPVQCPYSPVVDPSRRRLRTIFARVKPWNAALARKFNMHVEAQFPGDSNAIYLEVRPNDDEGMPCYYLIDVAADVRALNREEVLGKLKAFISSLMGLEIPNFF